MLKFIGGVTVAAVSTGAAVVAAGAAGVAYGSRKATKNGGVYFLMRKKKTI